jgi:hypothetical protein
VARRSVTPDPARQIHLIAPPEYGSPADPQFLDNGVEGRALLYFSAKRFPDESAVHTLVWEVMEPFPIGDPELLNYGRLR